MRYKKKKKRITLREINANLQDQVRLNGAVMDELLALLESWLPPITKRTIVHRIEHMRSELRGETSNETEVQE